MTIGETPQAFDANQSQELKARLLALTPQQLTGLRLSYHYRLLQARIRANGQLNLILGGLTLFLAISYEGDPTLKTIQAVLGISVMLISLWSIMSPLPVGLPIWSGMFGIAAAWNIFLYINYQSILTGVLGFLQLWWAF